VPFLEAWHRRQGTIVPMEDVHVVVKAQEVSQQEIDRLTATRQLSFHHHKLNQKLGITMKLARG
jgi:hypothetical protein